VGHDPPNFGESDDRNAAAQVDEGLHAQRRRMGRFQIVRKLGAGGMGVVYEAIDSEYGGRVALKTLRSITPRAVQRFKKEFRALTGLSHPNVVELRELHVDGDELYFTMELVHGSDLLSWVRAPGVAIEWSHDDQGQAEGPDYERLADAARQLVLGVNALHQHGKLHRDLKPSNVLVTEQGRVVVLDFGLITDTSDDEVHTAGDPLTLSGMVMGTPSYMSPEQADGDPLTPATDWYAVGVMLYEALTGTVPHSSETGIEMMVARATSTPADPRTLAPKTPDALAKLTMALLAKQPEDRPTAEQLLEALPRGTTTPRAPAPTRARHPLLGRDAALRTLHDAYNSASLGHTVVALVDGPSGIGKSALVEHLLRSLKTRDGDSVIILRGRCYEREAVPYKALDPLIDNLTRYLRRLSPAEVAGLLPRQIHSLTRLFPALLDVEAIDQAPRHAPADAQELRQRAFEALQELLARITDRRPLVLHIDDLQWTDDDSASLLLELLRPPHAPSLLLVATFRETEAASGGNPGLMRLIDGLSASRPKIDVRRISVGPLPPKHAAMLVGLILREHALPASLADRLAAESEGNPFFAGELVRYIASEAATAAAPPETLVTPRLTDVLAARIDKLPARARLVLQAVALAGRRLPQSVVLQAAVAQHADAHEDTDNPSKGDPVARLRAEHLVRTVGPPDARLIESDHDRIREAAVEAMSSDELLSTHRALAVAMGELPDPDPEHLLLHFSAAGDEAQAGKFAVLAANRAADQLAFDRAAELFGLAIKLGVDDPSILLRNQGNALANAGRGRQAALSFLSAAGFEVGATQLDLRRQAALHLLQAGYSDEGRAELTHVLEALKLKQPQSHGSAVAGILLRRAKLKLRGLSWDEDLNADPKALARLDACWTAARGLVISNIFEAGYFQAEHLLQALACGEPERVAEALAEEAKSASYFGDRGLVRARGLVQRVRDVADRIDTPKARASALAAEGLVMTLSARWVEGLEQLRTAETILRDECTAVPYELFDALACQAAALYALGDLPRLDTLCTRLAREATLRSNIYHGTMAQLFLAAPVGLAHDDVEGTRDALASIDALVQERKIQVVAVQRFNAASALSIYADTAVDDFAHHQESFAIIQKNPFMRTSFARAEVHSAYGRFALAAANQGATDRAERVATAKKLAKALIRQSFPSAAPMGRLLRAGVAHISGDIERAEADLRVAVEAFETLGMALWTAAAQRRLGSLIGGDSGFILRRRGEASLSRLGVTNVGAFTRLFAPGFPDDAS